MAGTILKIGKNITKTAESIKINSFNGDLTFNSIKSVVQSADKEIKHGKYEVGEAGDTEELKVTKLEGPEEVETGSEYTFKANGFNRKGTADELCNVKWAYQIDNESVVELKTPGVVIGSSVVKKIEIDTSFWDSKKLKVYAYMESPSDKVCAEVNIILKEVIIVVGTEQYYTTNSANKLMFAGQAVREVRKYLSNYKGLEVLIFKDGYTESQLSAFSNAILSYNKTARVVQVKTTEQLINFINYGQREGKKSKHEYRKVTKISVYAHGYVRSETNEGVIAFGYNGNNADKQELDNESFSKINKDVFLANNQSHFYSYACRTGIGVSSEVVSNPKKSNSLAQKMSNHGGITVHAYMKRSLYKDTWGTQNHRDTYVSDNDKGSSGWENFKTDIKDALNSDPNDMNAFLEYISTEVMIDGKIWNPKGAYLPVRAGSFPSGVSSNFETYKPN